MKLKDLPKKKWPGRDDGYVKMAVSVVEADCIWLFQQSDPEGEQIDEICLRFGDADKVDVPAKDIVIGECYVILAEDEETGEEYYCRGVVESSSLLKFRIARVCDHGYATQFKKAYKLTEELSEFAPFVRRCTPAVWPENLTPETENLNVLFHATKEDPEITVVTIRQPRDKSADNSVVSESGAFSTSDKAEEPAVKPSLNCIAYTRFAGNDFFVSDITRMGDQIFAVGYAPEVDNDWIDEFTETLNEIKGDEAKVIEAPKVGDFCISPTEDGNSRAQITTIDEKGFTLLWIDFGYLSTTKNSEDLWEVAKEFSRPAACSLLKFSSDDSMFVKDLVKQLEDSTEDIKITVAPVEFDEVTGITLVEPANKKLPDSHANVQDSAVSSSIEYASSKASEAKDQAEAKYEEETVTGSTIIEKSTTTDAAVDSKILVTPAQTEKLVIPIPQSISADITQFCPEKGFLVARLDDSFEVSDARLQTEVQKLQKLSRAPEVGDFIVAKWDEDDRWYRACVVSEDKDSFVVFFVDYGNNAVIEKSYIADSCREIEKEQAAEPMGFFWVDTGYRFIGDMGAISSYLDELYEDPAAEKQVVEIERLGTNKVSATIYVDGKNIVLSDKLSNSFTPKNSVGSLSKPEDEVKEVSSERSSFPSVPEEEPSSNIEKDNEPEEKDKENLCLEGRVNIIPYARYSGPDKPFVVLDIVQKCGKYFVVGNETDLDISWIENITESLDTISNKKPIASPKVGDFCISPTPDGTSRGQIMGISGDEKFEILWIDFGYFSTIKGAENLWEVTSEFGRPAACSLLDFEDEDDEFFEKMTKALDENPELEIGPAFISCDEETGITRVRSEKKEAENIKPPLTPALEEAPEKASDLKIPVPVEATDVIIEEFVPERGFIVLLTNTEEKLTAIQTHLDEAAPSQSPLLELPNVGDFIIAQWDEDNCWYRAYVVEKTDSSFKVFFVDFGNEAEISNDKCPKSCREILDTQCDEPMMSFMVHSGWVFDGDRDAVNAFLEEIYDKAEMAKKLQAIKVTGPISASALILVDGVDILDMFPGKFKSEGMSTSSKDDEEEQEEDSKPVLDSDKFEESNNSKINNLELEQSVEEESNQADEIASVADESDVEKSEENSSLEDPTASKNVENTKDAPSESAPGDSDPKVVIQIPSSDKLVVGIQEFCAEKGFLVARVDESSELEGLDDRLQSEALKLQQLSHPPAIGDFIIAKWEEDDRWYRAFVQSEDENNILVFFTDYGNCAEISKSCVGDSCRKIDEAQAREPMFFFWVNIRCPFNGEEETVNQFVDDIYENNKVKKEIEGVVQSSPNSASAKVLIDGEDIVLMDKFSGMFEGETSEEPEVIPKTEIYEEEVPLVEKRSLPSISEDEEPISESCGSEKATEQVEEMPEEGSNRVNLIRYESYSGPSQSLLVSDVVRMNGQYFVIGSVADSDLDWIESFTESLDAIKNKKQIMNPKIGDFCISPTPDGNSRAQIIDINSGGEFVLLWIDFGYSSSANKAEDLWEVSAEYARPAAFSMLSFADAEDKYFEDLNQSLDENPELVIQPTTVSCDKETGVTRVSLAEEEEPKKNTPESPALEEASDQKLTIPLRGDEDTQIQAFDKNGFLIARGDPEKRLDVLQEELEKCAPHQDRLLELPEEGDFIIAQWDEDKSWYRACVMEKKDHIFTVFFVDYGNETEIKNENYEQSCRKITEEQCKEPMMYFFVQSGWQFDGDEQAVNNFLDEIYSKEGMPKTIQNVNATGPVTADALILVDGVDIIEKFPGSFMKKDRQSIQSNAVEKDAQPLIDAEKMDDLDENDDTTSEQIDNTVVAPSTSDSESSSEESDNKLRVAFEKAADLMHVTAPQHTKKEWLAWIKRGVKEIE